MPEKEYNRQEYTEKQILSVLRSVLRRLWLRSKHRAAALLAARRIYKGSNKRQKYEYQCNICKEWFKKDDVQVDHVKADGHLTRCDQIMEYYNFLFTGLLQILCKVCHKQKTKEERRKR